MSKNYPVWILVKRSPDSEGWESHCLELDVVSQGETAKEAYDMGVEAAKLAMQWDLEEGHDPRVRRPAPAECYEDLHYLIDKGKKLEAKEALNADFRVIAVRVMFDLEKLARGEDCHSPPPVPIMRALAKAA